MTDILEIKNPKDGWHFRISTHGTVTFKREGSEKVIMANTSKKLLKAVTEMVVQWQRLSEGNPHLNGGSVAIGFKTDDEPTP